MEGLLCAGDTSRCRAPITPLLLQYQMMVAMTTQTRAMLTAGKAALPGAMYDSTSGGESSGGTSADGATGLVEAVLSLLICCEVVVGDGRLGGVGG